MKTLFVRIGQKTGPEKFFRCGMQFGRAWSRVDVDAATAERLHAEQMLEVTATQPADFVEPVDEDAEAQFNAALQAEAEANAAKEKAGAEAAADAEAQAAADAKAAAAKAVTAAKKR